MPDDTNSATSAPTDSVVPPVNPATPTDTQAPNPVASTTVADSSADAPSPVDTSSLADDISASQDILPEIASKIDNAHNILIALSSDPSVDEMAAAIGLSLFLDRLGKRATAIYSGSTPNALEFLKPEETFESTADALQDFVIALNKEKADHLRYKLDGDFVKIYITPYRTRVSEEDLDFSYGDFNVDLVLALDVANGIDLDSALREHGRIMHDAVIINITTGKPGKLGEIEWSDKTASSVSEMIARLLYGFKGKAEIGKEEATAFLTGIVAATNRFSNAGTTPTTMRVASRLMESGANQQLVSKNITPDVDNEMFSMATDGSIGSFEPSGSSEPTKAQSGDPTKLDIEHGNEEGVDETKEVDATVTEKESTLLDDLKAAEASLSHAGAETTPEAEVQPLKIDSTESTPSVPEASAPEPSQEEAPVIPAPEPSQEETPPTPESEKDLSIPEPVIEPPMPSNIEEPSQDAHVDNQSEKVIPAPSEAISSGFSSENEPNKYGQMLEDALAGTESPSEPMVTPQTTPPSPGFDSNPAAMNAPSVPSNPEINGVPTINYMPMPGEEVLPPPPTPPIDMGPLPEPSDNTGTMIGSDQATSFAATPSVEPIAPVIPNPAPTIPQPTAQEQPLQSQSTDPGAFKIPGV